MRTVGTTSRGVRCPVVREGDDLVKIVTDAILACGEEPVSYTHLDVYKRQRQCRMPFVPRQRPAGRYAGAAEKRPGSFRQRRARPAGVVLNLLFTVRQKERPAERTN